MITAIAGAQRDLPDIFTPEIALAIAADTAADNAVLPADVSTGDVAGAVRVSRRNLLEDGLVLSRLQAEARRCGRCLGCHARTNVVMGSGPLDADLFIICSATHWADDRTGIPLTGALELKSSRCTACAHFGACYDTLLTGMQDAPAPIDPCRFSRDPDKAAVARRLSDAIGKPETPGQMLAAAIVQARMASGRRPARLDWTRYVTLRRQHGLVVKEEPTPALYVTQTLRCAGVDREPAEANCLPWLRIERTFCRAPITLCLGAGIHKRILAEQEPDLWRTVRSATDPEQILAEPAGPGRDLLTLQLAGEITEALAIADRLRIEEPKPTQRRLRIVDEFEDTEETED